MATVYPVLFLVFNRPELTAQVFAAIRAARPARLYVAADGPRSDRHGEADVCARVRALATAVDWPCELQTLLRDENLGCRRAVSEAISWFFDHEQAGIILEDDCLPDPTFFEYCSFFLDRHRDDAQVMSISGASFAPRKGSAPPYGYTWYADMWGWATWRRAWKFYDVDMAGWPQDVGLLHRLFEKRPAAVQYWQAMFDRTASGQIETWDYQWIWSVIRNQGLVVTPRVNMISNLGWGVDATHTHHLESSLARLPLRSFPHDFEPSVPLRRDRRYERQMDAARFGIDHRSTARRIFAATRRLVGRTVLRIPPLRRAWRAVRPLPLRPDAFLAD